MAKSLYGFLSQTKTNYLDVRQKQRLFDLCDNRHNLTTLVSQIVIRHPFHGELAGVNTGNLESN